MTQGVRIAWIMLWLIVWLVLADAIPLCYCIILPYMGILQWCHPLESLDLIGQAQPLSASHPDWMAIMSHPPSQTSWLDGHSESSLWTTVTGLKRAWLWLAGKLIKAGIFRLRGQFSVNPLGTNLDTCLLAIMKTLHWVFWTCETIVKLWTLWTLWNKC